MLEPQSDSNVLYGLMAVQLGLISPAELSAALAEWAADRSRGLDAILADRGRIAPEAHAMLEPLVRGRVAYGPGASSGAASGETVANGHRRENFRETVAGLKTVADGGVGPMATVSHAAGRAVEDRAGVRFRILRPHNEGGLGIISVARDEELGRQVALKEIKLRYADDPDSRARFLLEAEVTGKLEHPGVVPIYGLGNYLDGRPYYAMRLIRGETFAEAIDRLHKGGKSGFDPVRRSFSSRQLLERFLDVCDTIEYAHSRGVVHRDIKPDNIMLGPYGETLVVDWGLARPMGESLSSSGNTGEPPVKTSELDLPREVEGTPTGTPRFMSPEQVRGELDRLGAPTDVYGLGATLYHLLCGEPPLRGVHGSDVFRRVEQGKIPQPRAVNRRVPRGLDAVCRKAMASRPEDRYPSARALAEDLRRWLADEPVSAWRESPVARLGRWGRRNRSSVLAGFLALLVISGVSLVAANRYRRAATSELRASQHARLALKKAEHAQEQEAEARSRAEQAHEQVVRGTARFAAEMIGREVAAIGRVLRAQAEAPEAAELLGAAVSSPDDREVRDALQSWIEGVFRLHGGSVLATNWFVDGPTGIQLARAPFEASVGQSFSFRDYFHGRGADLDPREAERLLDEGTLGMVEELHQTRVYRSTATGNPMATFSVPIRAPSRDGPPIGVLAISVEIGDFDVLRTDSNSGLVASLVDTRPDAMEDRAGLILQHPALEAREADASRRYHAPEIVDRLTRLRTEAVAVERESEPSARVDSSLALDRNFIDPFDRPSGGGWLAAFEPVIARNPEGPQDTGWVVVVQGKQLGAEASAAPSAPGAP